MPRSFPRQGSTFFGSCRDAEGKSGMHADQIGYQDASFVVSLHSGLLADKSR